MAQRALVVVPKAKKRYQQQRLPVSTPELPATPTTSDLLKALSETNPDYNAFLPDWQRYLNCYEGTNLGLYIFQHLRESDKSVKTRRERLFYLNYCQPVIDLYTHYIFSKPAIRKESPQEVIEAESYEGVVNAYEALASGLGEQGSLPANESLSEWRRWLRDVDCKGNSIDRFMSKVSRASMICGHVHVLVDMPRAMAPIQTEQDRLEQGIRPYLSMYYPSEVPDWGYNPDDGKLTWIRFFEPLPQKQEPFTIRDKKDETTQSKPRALQRGKDVARPKDGIYRTFTRQSWHVHQVKNGEATLVAEDTHPLGEVPVVTFYNKQHAMYPNFGQSLISDIAKINVSILNWSSLIDEEIYQKTLNILCVNGEESDKSEIVIGSDNVLQWNGQAAPFFLAPSSDPGAFIASQILQAREEIYRLAKLGGGLGLVSPHSVPSGVAQAFEFNETNRTLTEKADELEKGENDVHRFWHLWLALKWEGTVDYPEDFSVESFMDELDIALKAKQVVRSPTFKREIEKKIARKMLHNANPMEANMIGAEIDILPELVMGPFGPMYYTPEQNPSATPTTAEEISRSPFDKSPADQGNGEQNMNSMDQVDQTDAKEKKGLADQRAKEQLKKEKQQQNEKLQKGEELRKQKEKLRTKKNKGK